MSTVEIVTAVVAAVHGFNTLIRPNIPADLWTRLGVAGQLVDIVICGNYGNTANKIPVVDEQA